MSIVLKDVSKSFGEQGVLSHVSLLLEAGICYTLIGKSGAGKTTLLRLIADLESPDSGAIERCGSISYAFQEPRLFGQLTVRENILVLRSSRSADEILAALNLTEAADKYPHELSGGMKKRAGVARALAAEADVYLLDEPTGGQDAMHVGLVADAIQKYTAGAAVIVATHDDMLRRLLPSKTLTVKGGTCIL